MTHSKDEETNIIGNTDETEGWESTEESSSICGAWGRARPDRGWVGEQGGEQVKSRTTKEVSEDV